jgi:hypothetical protein
VIYVYNVNILIIFPKGSSAGNEGRCRMFNKTRSWSLHSWRITDLLIKRRRKVSWPAYGLLLTLSTLSVGVLIRINASGHDVGEPELEKLPIWKQCCGNGDCIPQHLRIIGREPGKKLSVEIEGVQTSVDKEKFSPVPSDRTWVCYVSPGGTITNENIRCILHPQRGGTT